MSKTGYAMSILGMPCLKLGMLCPFCCFRVNFGVFMSIFGLTGFAGSILGLCVNKSFESFESFVWFGSFESFESFESCESLELFESLVWFGHFV